ncbi:MAG: serine/threonine-protein kinase, partial [Gemmatimonadota bacterium]
MTPADGLIGQRLGGYRIAAQIGRGGMAAVYRARDEETGTEVALKVLPLDQLADPRDAERFAREAELAARLQHRHIVSVLGAGREGRYLYLAMELVEGETLRERLRREGHLPTDEALRLGAQLLEAVAVAHEHRIVHRDLKPDNALITPAGDLKILDFGVARLEGTATLTGPGEVAGTPEYMAPEQILGEPVGPEADLYAAGVMLYEMLAGSPPFAAESPATLVYHQLNEDPPAPSTRNPHLPRALDRLVLRLLDKLPENRGGSARHALDELERIRRHRALTRLPAGTRAAAEEAEAADTELRTAAFHPRFVGRQRELATLEGHVRALGGGG